MMNKNKKHKILNSRNGFTLVELLVSIAVFSIVVSIAAGGIVRAFRMQNQIVALISVNSNASLSIEQMSREIRVGYGFSLDGESLAFTNADGQKVTYGREVVGGRGVLKRWVEISPGNPKDQTITADNIDVEHLSFTLGGEEAADGRAARVTISIGIQPREIGVSSSVTNIQTTVSPRQLES